MVANSASSEYRKELLALRKAKGLHTAVENRLVELLKEAVPNFHPLKEPQGLAGGRNDLMLFEFSGRRVVFEILATHSQVSRDLLILYKTKADNKIAIIIDKEVDARVFERYLKENPDETFPFIFIGELFEGTPHTALLKLRELITGDEEAKFHRMLRAKISRRNLMSWFKQYGINVLSEREVKEGNISYAKVLITTVIAKCLEQGIVSTKLKKLGQWLSNQQVLEYIFLRVNIGLNVFLYTDLDENMAIYSDIDLVDWIRAGYNFPQTFILLSMNAVIYELEDKYLTSGKHMLNPDRTISMGIGSSQTHYTESGRVAVFNLPSEVKAVIVTPPMRLDREPEQYLEMIKISKPGDVIEIG